MGYSLRVFSASVEMDRDTYDLRRPKRRNSGRVDGSYAEQLRAWNLISIWEPLDRIEEKECSAGAREDV
uniref:Uncharacterized protein n=1 Tax=Hyaloperonospora arabidopsidis (strain Emoy2) TaxID=559515 RepID=M4B9R6_HYAAE